MARSGTVAGFSAATRPLGGPAIWLAPWDRWPRRALLLPHVGLGVKLWANWLGEHGPYLIPLLLKGNPRHTASAAIVVPICVVIGESVAWISSRLRDAERSDGQRMARMSWLVAAGAPRARQQERAELVERIAALATELPSALGAAVLLPGKGRDRVRAG